MRPTPPKAGKVFCTALRHKWLRSEKSVSVDVINLLGSCARPAIGELVVLAHVSDNQFIVPILPLI